MPTGMSWQLSSADVTDLVCPTCDCQGSVVRMDHPNGGGVQHTNVSVSALTCVFCGRRVIGRSPSRIEHEFLKEEI